MASSWTRAYQVCRFCGGEPVVWKHNGRGLCRKCYEEIKAALARKEASNDF